MRRRDRERPVTEEPLRMRAPDAASASAMNWINDHLTPQVQFDEVCVGSVDPWTLVANTMTTTMTTELSTTMSGAAGSAQIFDQPEAYIQAEYSIPDVNKFETLASGPNPVGILSAATSGDPEGSYRYRNLIVPRGFAHEMRAALVADGRCWGYLILLREPDRPDFTAREAEHLRAIVPRLGAAMRTSLLETGSRIQHLGSDTESGMVILGPRLRIEATNEAGDQLMEQIALSHPDLDVWPPIPVATLAAGVFHSPEASRRSLVRTDVSGWLWLRADRINTSDAQQRVVVTIEAAPLLAVAPLLLHAKGLTERETAVTLGALRGMSTKEIAESLMLSPYTVQDHLKATFAKTAVNSRRQLVQSVFPGVSPRDLF